MLLEAGYKPPMRSLMEDPNPIDIEMNEQLKAIKAQKRDSKRN